MAIGVAEAARALDIDRDLLKMWAFQFKEHLGPGANPAKGTPRQFTLADLRILAYVFLNWDGNPDLESIQAGLFQGCHWEETYDRFITSISPIFQDPPDDLDETWRHGSLVGGITDDVFDRLMIADSYRNAGDILVDAVPSSFEGYELLYPILYNYRHAIELYMKEALSSQSTDHDLISLLHNLRDYLKENHAVSMPLWFESSIRQFSDFDPTSTIFRYGEGPVANTRIMTAHEYWIDLSNLKRRMGWISTSFHKIIEARSAVG